MTHEDERRTLESFPEAKIIKVKKFTAIGKHYHKIKTEQFILCEGSGNYSYHHLPTGCIDSKKMKIGELIIVEPLTFHIFQMDEGSVLIGINSHPYDPTDDYKL